MSLEVLAHFHHTWASPSSYNAANLILVTSEVISMASNTFSICMNQWSAAIGSPPCECRRMMCPKPLEVTRTSLTTCYTSLCYSCRRNTYSLYKGLLIKYWWLVKCRWCLTSASWTPSTSSSSTSHLHSLSGKLNKMQYL